MRKSNIREVNRLPELTVKNQQSKSWNQIFAWDSVFKFVCERNGENTDNWASARVSEKVSLGQSLKICISNKFLGDADTADSESTIWEPLA